MNKYEAEIDGHSFLMVDDTTIEVWDSYDSEHPVGYITVKAGSIKSEKDFHYEVMDWSAKNIL